jgi:hypothetical protein
MSQKVSDIISQWPCLLTHKTTQKLPYSKIAVEDHQIGVGIFSNVWKTLWKFQAYHCQVHTHLRLLLLKSLFTFQLKALHIIVDVPWYVPNTVIRGHLQIPTVKEEIRCYSSQYIACLSAHPNDLIVNLIELPDNLRLWRSLPNDLRTRFLV